MWYRIRKQIRRKDWKNQLTWVIRANRFKSIWNYYVCQCKDLRNKFVIPKLSYPIEFIIK